MFTIKKLIIIVVDNNKLKVMKATQKSDPKIYEPFGEEWKKEMMKLPKKFIIDMHKDVYQKLQKSYDRLART